MNARPQTPALRRERARVGALRARAGIRGLGACGCGCGQAQGLGSLGAMPTLPTGVTTSQYTQALQAQISAQASSIQQTIASETGIDATNATTAQGASSAVSLLTGGYNPASSSDNANLVHVIAGGLCLVPGVGPILGGAVEALYAVGNALACPVTNAFASIGLGARCDAPPCSTSGNWTTASVLAENANELPAMPRGSFASLVVPALAASAAQWGNCKPGPPVSTVVDAVVNIWNHTHAGPAVPYLIPQIMELSGQPGGLLLGGADARVTGTTPSARAGQAPNIFYAFQPASRAMRDGVLTFLGTSITFFASGASAVVGYGLTPARLVMVNAGGLIVPHVLALHLGPATPAITPHVLALHLGPAASASARAPASSPMSAGGKVATAAGAAGAGALLWWLSQNGWKWRSPRWAAKLVR